MYQKFPRPGTRLRHLSVRQFVVPVLLIALCVGAQGTRQRSGTNGQVFQPGNAVRISVLTDTTAFLNRTYYVDEFGEVFLPIVGKTKLASQTPDELRNYLDSVYAKHLRYPSVKVVPLMRISFLGGFNRPGMYYVDPSTSFWHALSQAGGPQREDGLRKLRWMRGHEIVSRDMVSQITAGQTLNEIGMQSGDLIRVTTQPKRSGWQIFRNDVLPVLSLTLSAAATSITLYSVLSD